MLWVRNRLEWERWLRRYITLLFAVAAYEGAAEGYLQGLERRLAAGLPLPGIAACASFFVSRVDTAVDAQLPETSGLRGRAAVANARHAYRRFQEIFSGPRWERLAAAGAQPQRPLWASTGTKNPAYSDVVYVDELIGFYLGEQPLLTNARSYDLGNAEHREAVLARLGEVVVKPRWTFGGQDIVIGPRTPAEQLEKLAELHERGRLTDEEFDDQKARLLA